MHPVTYTTGGTGQPLTSLQGLVSALGAGLAVQTDGGVQDTFNCPIVALGVAYVPPGGTGGTTGTTTGTTTGYTGTTGTTGTTGYTGTTGTTGTTGYTGTTGTTGTTGYTETTGNPVYTPPTDTGGTAPPERQPEPPQGTRCTPRRPEQPGLEPQGAGSSSGRPLFPHTSASTTSVGPRPTEPRILNARASQ